ncbi:hypothetical protein QLS71_016320 [Mariniflexile litorale]|uniref:DUF4374 domain-containing protein n=1 Tax=Mariniflexile litorale TaxID=3045158 RepID=A0AAU7EE23_9FLAO|nr:hypothetical protein [Mariniflexile sp. KMM 9835]MDQ8212289.1 hypothetical protein [Mariniflexile sp. KMM 9835]
MNKLKYLFFALVLGATTLTSCESNDDIHETEKNITFAMFIVTDAASNSGLLVPFKEMPTGDIDVSKITNGIQLAKANTPGISYNGAVYNTSNTAGNPGIQKFSLADDNTFFDDGFIPTNSQYAGGNMFGLATPTKGYYSNDDLSQTALQIFNPETMQRIGQVDCSSQINAIKAGLTGVVSTSLGGFVIERDGKVFTEVYFSDADKNQVVDKTYVAIIDVATDTLDKIIVWNDFILLGYGLKNTNYINFDDNNNLYLGGFYGNHADAERLNFRTLRIKSGETDFDTTWDINAVRDFNNGENFALGGAIVGNKMYIKMFENTITNAFGGVANLDYYAYEVDLTTKQPTKISDIPAGYWKSVYGPSVFNDKPYFVVENDAAGKVYLYSYDTNSKTSTKEITLLGGSPSQLIKL